MDSLQLDPETVDNLDTYNHIPPILMEKCAALSVRPETVKNLVQSMQGERLACSPWLNIAGKAFLLGSRLAPGRALLSASRGGSGDLAEFASFPDVPY